MIKMRKETWKWHHLEDQKRKLENNVLNINESVAFYNSQVAPQQDSGLGIYYDSTGKDDALLLCNGILKLNTNSNNLGYIGGYITHMNSNGSALLDFKLVIEKYALKDFITELTKNYFKENYGSQAESYLSRRIEYNNSNIG